MRTSAGKTLSIATWIAGSAEIVDACSFVAEELAALFVACVHPDKTNPDKAAVANRQADRFIALSPLNTKTYVDIVKLGPLDLCLCYAPPQTEFHQNHLSCASCKGTP
jgi:hypothetical protein